MPAAGIDPCSSLDLDFDLDLGVDVDKLLFVPREPQKASTSAKCASNLPHYACSREEW
jgi:hypothetical protein